MRLPLDLPLGHVLLAVGLLAFAADARAADPPPLSLPVVCEPGKSCFIQHHVDIDPSKTVQDFHCNGASYDGHDGIDFRLLSAAAAQAGIAVVAAAPGRVLRVRDGMPDVFVRDIGKRAITNRECGNAIVIEHSDGLETQYCHLQNGSVAAKAGQLVERGDALAKVGYSGAADFAHLHFTVRLNGRIVDPFSGRSGGRDSTEDDSCRSTQAPHAAPLWEPHALRRLSYRASEIIQVGFASELPRWEDLERDHGLTATVTATSNLMMFARAMNISHRDRVVVTIQGPDGVSMVHAIPPVEGHKAIYVFGAGLRLGSRNRWPAGTYRGTAEIHRENAVTSAAFAVIELR